MTVLTTDNRRAYTGDGSTSVFPFPVRFLSDADVKVAQRINDEEVLLTIGTDYSVSGAGEAAGGSVTFVSAPAAGVPIVIYNDPPMTQDVDYQEDDEFPANTHERALDKLTILVQRLAGRLSRALLYDETADSVLTASEVLGRVGDAETARDQAQAAQVASESAKTDAEAARDAAQATAASVDGTALQAGIDANAAAIAGKADQAAVDAVNTELDAVLPDGATGTFTRPRMTTTARDALDMTGKAAGYEIYNTTTGQVETWDGVSDWGGVSSGLYESGDLAMWHSFSVPTGWTEAGSDPTYHTQYTIGVLPSSVSSHCVCQLTNGRVLYYAQSSNCGTIDIETGVVTATNAPPTTDIINAALYPLSGDRALLVGGRRSGGSVINNICLLYTYSTNSWTTSGTMQSAVWGFAGCVDTNDDVFVFGGLTDSGGFTKTTVVQKWTESTGTWANRTATPLTNLGDVTYQPTAVALPSEKILYGGRQDSAYRIFDDTLNSHSTPAQPGSGYAVLSTPDLQGSGPALSAAAGGGRYSYMIYDEVGDSWEYIDSAGTPTSSPLSWAWLSDGTMLRLPSTDIDRYHPRIFIKKD